MIYTVKKTLADHGDKASDEEKSDIEAKIATLEEKIGAEDTAAITAAMEELMKASHKLAERVYQESAEEQQQAGGEPQPEQPAGATSDSPDDENVIDADFEVKD